MPAPFFSCPLNGAGQPFSHWVPIAAQVTAYCPDKKARLRLPRPMGRIEDVSGRQSHRNYR